MTTSFANELAPNSPSNLGDALVGADSVDELARVLVSDGFDAVGADAGSFIAFHRGRFRILAHDAIDLDTIAGWSEFTMRAGQEPFSDAIRSGHPLFFESSDALTVAYPHLAATVEASGHRSWAALPLIERGVTLGAIGLAFEQPQDFETSFRGRLSALCAEASRATARLQTIDEQADAIASVSRLLHTEVDAGRGFTISRRYEPASRMALAGGDFYDVIALDDRVVALIADVADHGPTVAGETVRARSTLQALSLSELWPRAIAQSADAALKRFSPTHTTACIAGLDRRTGLLRWTSAGHPYPLVRRADGTVEILAVTHGPPLGITLRARPYAQSVVRLDIGDTLVLYTDGLIERRDEPIDESIDRLAEALAAARPTELADQLYGAFLGHDDNTDDVAILTLTLTEGA